MEKITVNSPADNVIELQEQAPIQVAVSDEGNQAHTVIIEEKARAHVDVTIPALPEQLMVTYGGSVYRQAVEGGFVGTEVEWITSIFDSKASMTFVEQAFANQEEAFTFSLNQYKSEVGNTYATLAQLAQTSANEQEARSALQTQLTAEINSSTTALNNSFSEALATQGMALSQEIGLLQTNVENNYATNLSLSQAISDTTSAFAQNLDLLETNVANNYATNLTLNQAITTEQEARSTALTEQAAQFNEALGAEITTLSEAIATESLARASQVNNLGARLDQDILGLNTQSQALIEQINTVETNLEQSLAQSRTDLTAQIGNVGTATNQRIDSVIATVDGTLESISSIEGQVNHEDTGLSATFSTAQAAKATADGAALSITEINNTIESLEEDFASSNLLLETIQTAQGQLKARAALSVNINNEVTGLEAEAGAETSKLRLRGDVMEMLPTSGNDPLLSLNTQTGLLDIRARLILGDGHTVSSLDDIRGQDGAEGPQGPQGVPGEPGEDGEVLYTWIRYADNNLGEGISNSPDNKKYIGFAYNKESPIESNDPNDYWWSKITGEDGVPGPPGEDGQTLYTWIAYSDNPDGTGMYQQPNENTRYVGIAINKPTFEESSDPSDYTWSKFRGEDGDQGPQGVPGPKGEDGVIYYTWIRYADDVNGGGISNDPTNKVYMGLAYNKLTPTESNNPADYTWSRFRGEQGTQGVQGPKGEDGETTYTWIAYSDNADGSGMYQVPLSTTEYIGIAVNKTTAVESTNPSDYVWSKFRGDQGAKGDKGDTGDTGPQGVPGVKGDDGVTTYTWIRYADSINGSGISNSPVGKDYIGLAYNKLTDIESNTPSDYTWSLIKGEQGDQGVEGPKGDDGESLYTWIKYSDFSDGSGLYDNPNANTLYIGIAVNKTSPTESTNKADYVWSKFKGETGAKGDTGDQGPIGPIGPVGPVGPVGSGWYSATFTSGGSSPTQSLITSTFTSVANRAPVNGDVLFATLSTGQSQGYARVNNTWTTSALTVNGSIIASETISGAQLTADAIDGKIITGALIRTAPTNFRVEIDGRSNRPHDYPLFIGESHTNYTLRADINGNLDLKSGVRIRSDNVTLALTGHEGRFRVMAGSDVGSMEVNQLSSQSVNTQNLAATSSAFSGSFNIAAGTDLGLPSRIIGLNHLKSELASRLVLVDPNEEYSGGSADVTGSIATVPVTLTASPAIPNGGRDLSVTISFSGSRVETIERSDNTPPPLPSNPSAVFRWRRNGTNLAIPAATLSSLSWLSGSATGYTVVGTVTQTQISSYEPQQLGGAIPAIWERTYLFNRTITFNYPNSFSGDGTFSQVIASSNSLTGLFPSAGISVTEEVSSESGFIINTNWEAVSQKPFAVVGTGLTVSGSGDTAQLNVANPFNPTGNYTGLRAQATTKADVGLSGIPNTNSSTSNYLRGDGTWATPPNTTYSLISEAEITTGTATTSRVISAQRLKFITDQLANVNHNHSFAQVTGGTINLSGAVTGSMFFDGSPEYTIVTTAAAIPLSGLVTTGTASSTTYLRGDGAWVTPTNTITSIRRDNTGTYRTGNINLVGGTNVTISETSAGTFQFNATDTNTTYSAGSGISLSGTTFSVAGGNGLVQETSGLALGTPGTITGSSTNSVTATSHTHALTVNWGDVGSKPTTFTPSAHTHNASDINAGTLAAARLSGTYTITVSGNATTATTLQTARTINGTNFDGSANITTANWGTARTLTIGSTGKSVNGGGNVSWTLAEIGAAASSHTHNASDINAGVLDYARLPISSNDVSNWNNKIDGRSGVFSSASGLVDSRALFANTVTTASTGVGFEYNILLNAQRKGITISQSGTGLISNPYNLCNGRLQPNYSSNGVNPADPFVLHITGLPNTHTQTGGIFGWTCRYWVPTRFKVEAFNTHNNTGWVTWIDRSDAISAQAAKDLVIPMAGGVGAGNFTEIKITIYDSNGSVGGNGFRRWGISEIFFIHPEAARTYENAHVGWADELATARTINGTSFNGGGNITTANWGTSRTLTVGNTGKAVNGSENVSWSLAEIGAADRTITLSGGDGITSTIGNLTANRSISVDNTVIRTTGNQTIGGQKTFSGTLVINPDNSGPPLTIIQNGTGRPMLYTFGGNYSGPIIENTDTGGRKYQLATTRNASSIGGGKFIIADVTSLNRPGDDTSSSGLVRLSIDSSGNVGVGTDSPTERLHVNGKIRIGTQATATTDAVRADRSISTGSGLSGGGNLTSDRTLAVDGTVIRTTGNQSMSGAKSFTGEINVLGSAFAALSINRSNNTNVVIGYEANNGGPYYAGFDVTTGEFGFVSSVIGISSSNIKLNVNGNISTSGVFSGNGSGLTALNGSNISSGTVADARIASTLVRDSRSISTGDGLSGGGNLTANRTLAVDATVVRTSRSIISGDGLNGGGNLSGDRTLTVDNTVIRTTGDQVMNGEKTFAERVMFSVSSSSASFNLLRNGTSSPTGTEDGDVWYRSSNIYYNNLGTIRTVAHTGSWSVMSVAEGQAGTATTSRFMRADRLGGIISAYAPTLGGAGASGTWGISVNGNASTATTLQTARTINGTSFNGSANITTANWGTARTLTVGATGKSVNGSGNVSWSLAEIGAAARTVTLSGGDGITNTIGDLTANRSISVDGTVVRTSGNQTLGGVKTFTSTVRAPSPASSWIGGHTGNSAVTITTNGTAPSYHGWVSQRTPSGGFSIGVLGDVWRVTWATSANIDGNVNQVSQLWQVASTGNCTALGTITAVDHIATSDIRTKENLNPITEALSKVNKLKGVTFNRKTTPDRREGGYIAQDLEAVLPEGVTTSQDGTKLVSNSATIGLLIEAVKELSAEVERLKRELNNG